MNTYAFKAILFTSCLMGKLIAQDVSKINTMDRISVNADNENSIDVLKRIFNVGREGSDEQKFLRLFIVGDVLANSPKITCDLKDVPREIAASLICEKVGYGHEIMEPYFLVKIERPSRDQIVRIIFLGRIAKLFGGVIDEDKPEKDISEELSEIFGKISNGITKGVEVTYSGEENSMIVKASREQVEVIESIVSLGRLGVLFKVNE